MTRRELMKAVFEGRAVGTTPVCVRLNLWHNDCVSAGSVPAEVKGLSCGEVEDYLGFVRSSRYLLRPALRFHSFPVTTAHHGDITEQKYVLPGHTLTRLTRLPAAMARQGMRPHITAYPLQCEKDYDALLACLEDAYLDFCMRDFDALNSETGDAGLPMVVAGQCPAHLIMLGFAGYQNFYLHMADFPEKVNRLIEEVERVIRRDLWPALGTCGAGLVLHGAHFSSQMTPPPVFEKYFVPYFTAFNRRMHEYGKITLWHADAEMGALLGHVLEAGFDGADCLLSAPATQQKIATFLDAWQGRIVCWGGLPSMIFDASYPLRDYGKYLAETVESTQGRDNFIFGASDHVMPGAPWERLRLLAEITGTCPGK